MLLAVAGLLAAENAPEPTFAEVNKALGLELLVDDNLWDDEAKAVADRLDWPEESATKSDASYRLYPPERQRLLGCRPYSCAFLAEQGKPWSLSLMFANKGDAVTIKEGPFQNYEGTVDETLPDKGLVRVLVTIFGRQAPVELEYWQIAKAEK